MSNFSQGEMEAQSATLPSLHQTPPELLHNSTRASTKKLFVSGVHPCRLAANIMTGGPRLHAAMALHSRPKGHHCMPRGSSSSQSPYRFTRVVSFGPSFSSGEPNPHEPSTLL